MHDWFCERMKKIIFTSTLFIVIFSCLKTNCIAQLEKGQIVVNVGVGYSPEFNGDLSVISISYPVNINSYNIHQADNFIFSSITPNLGGSIDYSFSRKGSIGLAACYQSEIINYDLPPYYSDKMTRINMALRFLDHLNPANPLFDNYIGLRIGCSYWQDIPSTENYSFFFPPLYFIASSHLLVPSFQFLYGVHIFISYHVGFQFEAALGSPYLAEGGATIRINTRTRNNRKDSRK
jgi:hypothetical protein